MRLKTSLTITCIPLMFLFHVCLDLSLARMMLTILRSPLYTIDIGNRFDISAR